MLGDHRTKLFQHVIQLCIEPLEFPVVAQRDRGNDVHVVAQACDVAGQPLQRATDKREVGGLASIVAQSLSPGSPIDSTTQVWFQRRETAGAARGGEDRSEAAGG